MKNRYVTFLDILGFSDMVENESLQKILAKFNSAQYSVASAVRLGISHNTKSGTTLIKQKKPLLSFSFSDTFIFCSHDDSYESFLEIIIATNILTRQLFAFGMPVRGAISIGEAEAIPNTHHFIGKAIIKAARLEKLQNWFGVVIDPDCFLTGYEKKFNDSFVQALAVKYKVPLKKDDLIDSVQYVINWRLNLQIKEGIRSLFRNSEEVGAREKIQNTLDFSQFVVANKRQNFYVEVKRHDNKKEQVVWLNTLYVGNTAPQQGMPYAKEDGY